MGRHAKFHVVLPATPTQPARRVGYSLGKRGGGVFKVHFKLPDDRRVERSTDGCRVLGDAHAQAQAIITEAYRLPDPHTVSWDDVVADVRATPGLRAATVKDYLKAITAFRVVFPHTPGPGAVTPEMANRFNREYQSRPFKKGRKSDAPTYRRSPTTVRSCLRKLSSLWAKHLTDMGAVTSNPWKGVRPPPQNKRRPECPTDETIAEFREFLARRFPDWPLIRLWVEVKILTACRTTDLCSLLSNQLRDGRLHFLADQVKNRADRAVLLPPWLYAALRDLAGPTYLWEKYKDEVHLHRRGRRTVLEAYTPEALYHTVDDVFDDFNEQPSREGKPRLRPHDLRRRTITMAAYLTGSVDKAAQAIGVHPVTARQHYVDAQMAFEADGVYAKLAELNPPPEFFGVSATVGEDGPRGSSTKPPKTPKK